MPVRKYEIGQRFGNWTLLERLPKQGTTTRWRVKCDCGLERNTASSNIVSGKSKMCRSCAAKKRWAEGRGPRERVGK